MSSGHKYWRDIYSVEDPSKYIVVDVYCVLAAFGDPTAPVAHAIKKLLCAGQRGHKDYTDDLKEAIDAIQRAIDMAPQRVIDMAPLSTTEDPPTEDLHKVLQELAAKTLADDI